MNFNWSSIIQAIVTPLLIAGAFYLFSKIKGLKATGIENFTPTEDQIKEYQSYMRFIFIIYVLTATASGFGLYYLFLGIANAWLSLHEPYDAFSSLPDEAYGIPALFLGLLLPAYPIEKISIKVYGQETYQMFLKISDKQYGFSSEKLGKILVKGGVLICIPLILNCLKSTTYLHSETITFNGFTTIRPTEKLLKDVKEIVLSTRVKALNGNIVSRLKFHVVFIDGFKWDFEARDNKEFIRILQFKTAAPYREVEFF